MNIIKQINLLLLSINKFNFRLIKISQYLSQFKLNVRYKFDKQHIVFDILFKLINDLTIEKNISISEKNILDEIYIFNKFLIKIIFKYKKNLRFAYLSKSF